MRITFFIFLLVAFIGKASSAEDISSGKVTLLTCTPGADLYSVFGHSAIRIQGRIEGRPIDKVYNFGTFEFDDGFIFRFAQGRLDYMLSASSYANFEYGYIYEGRGITEQTIQLTPMQIQEMYNHLEWHLLPENRYYLYHFFYDNCATRIRDVFEDVLGEGLEWHYQMNKPHTFRDMIQLYLNDMPWSDFGIDLALGMPCDEALEYGDEMFLPDFLYEHFQVATLNGVSLVSDERPLLPNKVIAQSNFYSSPQFLFWVLAVIIFIVFGLRARKHRSTNRLVNTIFILFGLVGIMVTLLWFATDHTTTKWNLNMLWSLPPLFMPFINAQKHWGRRVIYVYVILLLLMIAFFAELPQDLHQATIPIMLMLFLGCIMKLFGKKIESTSAL